MRTTKGSDAIFNYKKLVDFVHKAESVLDKLRNHETEISIVTISIFLDVKDLLCRMIDKVIQNDCAEEHDDASLKNRCLRIKVRKKSILEKEIKLNKENVDESTPDNHKLKIIMQH